MKGSGASKDNCPVCREHTDNDCYESEGLVLTGVTAILEGNGDTVALVQEQMSPFEAHTAMSMMAGTVYLLCRITGTEPHQLLDVLRKGIDERMANEATD